MKKHAFTLAEVLITLAIIGVVAAMTIPTLISKYQEKVTVSKVLKMYSIISQAYQMAKINDASYNPAKYTNIKTASQGIYDIFKDHLKISRDCGFEAGCFPNARYKLMNGNNTINFLSSQQRYMVKLSDGSAIAFYGYTSSINPSTTNTHGAIYYDVNGESAPNTFGIDAFQIEFNSNGIISWTILDDYVNECITNGFVCSEWILRYKNMDYTKYDEETLKNKYGLQ